MRFGGVVAVDNVDFQLEERELRCLIGPNGAGKSTFFKCLAGMLKPTSGEIYLHDEETTGWDPHRIAAIGVGTKTQVPSVMDGLTVRENIWMSAFRHQSRKQARHITEETIDRLRLGDIANTDLGVLAHGERQRVELAIVVAGEPWLILLDEPAAGMTGDEVEQMRAMIEELNRRASIIIVEHDMQFIQSIARKVTVFYRGAVLIEDDVNVVMTDQRVRDVYLGKSAH
jgi:ABC-type uncharacterized transport system ATPase subunit